MTIVIKITETAVQYDIEKSSENIGALVSFSGIVKDKNNGIKVKCIHYIVFDKLFICMLKKYCISIIKNKKEIKIYINQYSGIAYVGETNLIISVQTKDRKTAFLICHKILEFIKNNSPIWKKEIYMDETSKWINA